MSNFDDPFEDESIYRKTKTPTKSLMTGHFIDGFEIIESKPTCSNSNMYGDRSSYDRCDSSEGVLIDISNDEHSIKSCSSAENVDQIVVLLTKPIIGLRLQKINVDYRNLQKIELVAGTLLRSIKDAKKYEILNKWFMEDQNFRNVMVAPMEMLVQSDTLAMVTSNDSMTVSEEQTLRLLAVNPEDRLSLYKDIERFDFILNLKVGSKVLVDVDNNMRRVPATVRWIGEQPNDRPGIWYQVDFEMDSNFAYDRGHQFELNSFGLNSIDGNQNMSCSSTASASMMQKQQQQQRGLYYGPHQIHMPLKENGVTTTIYDNRQPIRPSNSTPYEDNRKPQPPPRGKYRQNGEVNVVRNVPIIRKDENVRMSRAKSPEKIAAPQEMEYPTRSTSAHTISSLGPRTKPAPMNERVNDESLPIRIGDSCVWNNNDVAEKGVVRYIGYLKNQTGLFAGVEFKNKIGAGTGVFSGEQLFIARNGHAGFVEYDRIESVNAQHRRRLSSSRSNHFPTSAGSIVSVPVQGNYDSGVYQSSTPPLPSSLPPRYTSAASSSSSPVPPSLPPKPQRYVEDYLIESFEIGTHVNVCHLGAERTGVVRWLGDAKNEQGDGLEQSAVVQLDVEPPTAWRSSTEIADISGIYVSRSVLVPVVSLRRRKSHSMTSSSISPPQQMTNGGGRYLEFGSIDSGVERQKCLPARDLVCLIGRQKGIQGYRNSCYIDATLYAMFVQSTNFDFLLEKPVKGNEKCAQFQKLLAHEIVFPLRKFHYVRADHVMRLRQLLAELMPHMTGLTSEEKDPEEILAFIFADIFKAEPFIKLIGPNKAVDTQYLVPIVIDNDWQGGVATSQHLLERHMKSAQVKFAQPPPVLIMQLPRYGQQKVFDKILPLERIDITGFVLGAVAACSVCGGCAECYCPTCFLTRRVFFQEILTCRKCFMKKHDLPELVDHAPRDVLPPSKPSSKPHAHGMVLSAVLCIETSHYVAFVRTPSGQWVFFDSMADREGLTDGYNVPVVSECKNMSHWLSLDGWKKLKDADEVGHVKEMFRKGSLDPLVSRLLSDSYICIYENANMPLSQGNLINTIKNIIP